MYNKKRFVKVTEKENQNTQKRQFTESTNHTIKFKPIEYDYHNIGYLDLNTAELIEEK